MNKNLLMILSLFVVVSVLAVGCAKQEPSVPGFPSIGTEANLGSSQELKKFSSTAELADYLQKSQASQNYGMYARSGGIMMKGVAMENAVAGAPAPTSAAADSAQGGSQTATDFSQTNVQVQGVDEADIVKNDDKYIYTVVQDKVVITDAFPAENMKIVSKIEVDGTPQDLFINKDRLVVFTSENDKVYNIEQYDFVPRLRYVQTTHVYIYDVTNRSSPALVKNYSVRGEYFDARMIGEYVYLIAKDPVYYYNRYVDMPVIMEGSKTVVRPDVYYFDNPEQNFVFHTVASFNVQSAEKVEAKTYMMGYSNTVYVSKDAIYITYQKNYPYYWYGNSQLSEDEYYKVVVPLIPYDAKKQILVFKDDTGLSKEQRWDKISTVLENMYNGMTEDDKDDLVEKIDAAVQEYRTKLEQEMRKTVIHKIKIDNGNIDYDTRGEVSGYLLNQFSMDENGDYFRVATTTELYTGTSKMYNNVYVLDNKLSVVGKLENIAPDERIYSTRFMGDRLYMVTFKRMDPLFVIDLGNPSSPKVLGELKIPGFSDYLHPYDEDHIIGVGKETGENEWGGVSTKGIKIALFDVSDVSNPAEMDHVTIGQAGSDSEALQDHKAFLFDKEKDLLVIPIREVKGTRYHNDQFGYYQQKVWQGAYVFSVSPKDGFVKKGTISHYEGEENVDWYWGSPRAVRRSLFMDDVLYTVSGSMIKANSLENVSTELNSIDLPYKGQNYPYPIPYLK